MEIFLIEFLQKLHFQLLSLLSFFISLLFFYKWRTTPHSTNTNTPPSPPKLPILGNLHQFGKLLHRSFRSLSQQYGDVMLVHIGSRPSLIISSADAAEEIMKTHDIVFANRPKLRMALKILYDGKDIAFANYGEYWRQMKSMCVVYMFSSAKIRSFRSVREEEVGLAVEQIRKLAKSNAPVNLSDIFIRITNDVVCRVAFGRKYTGEAGCPNLMELMNEFSEALGSLCMQDFIPWLGWVDYVSGLERKANKVAKTLDEFIEKIVQEHTDHVNIHDQSDEDAGKVQDLVDILLQVQKENTTSLPNESVKGIILDMLGGGTDTTFALLEWVMTELLRHPNAMKELQDEVRGFVKSKQGIDEDDLKNMKYLKAVIKETLRLHPPLPLLLVRQSSQDVKIKGYDIPTGTQVMINAWAIQRDPASWENPDKFRPERFLNSVFDFKGQDFRYIPFGAGRRGCPGLAFGLIDAESVLANLVYEFDWKLPDGVDLDTFSVAESAGTTIRRLDPLLAIPIPYCSM